MSAVLGARDLLRMVRKGVDVNSVHAHSRKPFRFLLCGDPAYVADLRALLLAGHAGGVPFDAAACLETLTNDRVDTVDMQDVRAVIFLGRQGDATADALAVLCAKRVPVFALTIDPEAEPSGPDGPPAPGSYAEYVVTDLSRETLRGRFFVHLVECAKGVEVAVGRRLPALRSAVAAKLTREAANTSLKVALASAVVDHVPLVGVVLGVFASAGDTVAITGIQLMLLLQIEAAYGKDPDLQRMWELLPVIGGGIGWRALARELSGFIPVAGIGIKGAIAYAGTVVVGEGVAFFLENGTQMSGGQAAQIYENTKRDAMRFARDLIAKLRT